MTAEKTADRVGWTAWAAIFLPSLFTFMASFGVLLIGGMGGTMEAIQEAGAGFYLVVACTMFAVFLASALLFMAARGKTVPGGLILFTAILPWLAGLGAARWGAHQVAQALTYADPAMKASLATRGTAEATLSLSYGSLLSGALAAAVALGLALGALGQGAPERRGLFAALSLLGLPMLGMALVAVSNTRAHGGTWLLALPALLAFPVLALAGASLGKGEAAARANALCCGAAGALTLSFMATGVSLAQHNMQVVLAAVASADASSRATMIFRGVMEIETLTQMAVYAALVALLATLITLGLAASRSPTTPGRLAGGMAAGLALLVGIALPYLPAPDLGITGTTHWGTGPGVTALSTRFGDASAAEPEMTLGAEGLQAGETLPSQRTQERIRHILSGGQHAGDAERCGRLPYDAPRVGLDARVGASQLRSFVDEATHAELAGIVWVARRPRDPETTEQLQHVARLSPILALLLDAPYSETGVLLKNEATRRCLESQAQRWSASVGATPLETVTARHGESHSLTAEPSREDRMHRGSGRPLVELQVTESTTPEALFETAARLDAVGMRAVLVGSAVARAPDGAGDGVEPVADPTSGTSGTAVAQHDAIATVVTSGAELLSHESIQRVMQRHQNTFRYCFERELARDPAFSIRVNVEFVIESAGTVRGVQVHSDDASAMQSHPAFGPCVHAAISRARFPARGADTSVRYPLIFNVR